MKVKLQAFVDAIQQTQEDEKKQMAPALANQAKAELGVAVSKLEIEIGKKELAVAKAASVFPLNVDAIVSAQDDLALLNRRLEQLKELNTELFPSKTK